MMRSKVCDVEVGKPFGLALDGRHVDSAIQRAVLVDCSLHHCLRRRRIRHVDVLEHGCPTGIADCRRNGLTLAGDVGDDDSSACRGKGLCRGLSHATATSRDDHRFAFEMSHRCSLVAAIAGAVVQDCCPCRALEANHG